MRTLILFVTYVDIAGNMLQSIKKKRNWKDISRRSNRQDIA
jgi:hypothetical protein